MGHDKRLADYEELARRLGVHVRFVGGQPDPRRFFAAADAFIFPSRYDIFGQAGLEALASGLPVIASAASGVSELLERDHNGYILSDPESPKELGEQMIALTDPQTRGRMAEAARHTAEKYCWQKHFDLILRVYEEVRGARRSE